MRAVSAPVVQRRFQTIRHFTSLVSATATCPRRVRLRAAGQRACGRARAACARPVKRRELPDRRWLPVTRAACCPCAFGRAQVVNESNSFGGTDYRFPSNEDTAGNAVGASPLRFCPFAVSCVRCSLYRARRVRTWPLDSRQGKCPAF
jgi:hypothetical protein